MEINVKSPSRYGQSLSTVNQELLGELWTIAELSAILKVPKSWVYERTRKRGADKLPYIKLGKYVRFEESAIKKFLVTQRNSAQGL